MDATTASDMLTVLQYVDHFYATSWNHLIICGSVAVGIVGVVIPLLIQIYQGRTMRHERSEIRTAIVGQVSAEVHDRMGKERVLLEEKIGAATKSLEDRLARDRADLEEGMRKTEAELEKKIANTLGSVFHVQTNMVLNQGAYKAAFLSGMSGISQLVKGEDHLNLRRLIKVIVKCLAKLNKTEIEEEEKTRFNDLMKQIGEWDKQDNFSDVLDDARRTFRAACDRVLPAKPGTP